MYVTSILSTDLFKLNAKMSQPDFEKFKTFVKDYNSANDVYCFVDKHHTGHAIYFCTELEAGKDLIRLFQISQGTPEEDAFTNAFGKQSELYKYVANFHTSNAADEFVKYLNELDYPDFKGVDKKVRNSVIYFCQYSEIGYDLAKKFEADYLTQILEKPIGAPPEQVHPITENEKIYDLKVEVIPNEQNTIHKIFSLFKGNSPQ